MHRPDLRLSRPQQRLSATSTEKTPINTLQNVHFGVSSPVKVGAGDTITLRLASDFFAPIQWNAAKGPGASLLSPSSPTNGDCHNWQVAHHREA